MKIKSFLENHRNGLLVLFLLLVFQASSAQSKYIKQYKPIADSLSEIYGVPTSVMLGVAIIESGAGKSRNCKLLNNHFGVKGKNDLLKTKGIKSSYKQYPDGRAFYVAFCKLMTRKKFYPKLKSFLKQKLKKQEDFYIIDDNLPDKGKNSAALLINYITDIKTIDIAIIKTFECLLVK